MDFSRLADFNLVARHRGFGKASRESGRSKASLSRRVAELEAAMGIRLIERDVRAFCLTPDGSALHERTEPLLAEAAEASVEIAGNASVPRGRLRVSAPLLFSHLYMGRIAARFCAEYPEVELELTAEDRQVDLIEEGYDAVIRINPADSDLVGVRFMTDRQVIVAHPSVSMPSALDNSNVPAFVLSTARRDTPWKVVVGSKTALVFPHPICRLPSLLMVYEAIKEGTGAAALPCSLVAADIEEGRLSCWADVDGGSVDVWVLHTSRRLASSKVRAFVEFVMRPRMSTAPA